MIYFVCAFIHEARPFIDRLRLRRDTVLPWPVFTGEGTLLIVCGMGVDNAQIATAALLGWHRPGPEDLLVNVGICAAPKTYPLGSLLLANRLRHNERNRRPDITVSHACETVSLCSVDTPVTEPVSDAVDMEAFGVFRAGERFFQKDRMLFFKIVSDHFEPSHITKTTAQQLVDAQADNILQTVTQAQQFHKDTMTAAD